MSSKLYYEQGWFWLLLVLPLIVWIFITYLRRRQPVVMVTTISQLPAKKWLSISPPAIFLIIRLLALLFIVLALANFRTQQTVSHKKKVAGANIILAVDVSQKYAD